MDSESRRLRLDGLNGASSPRAGMRLSTKDSGPPSSLGREKNRREMEGEASSCAMYKNPKEISTRAMTMKRHKKADSLFRAKFGIPDGEIFLDEYHCALQKKILIQGRMYVFEHYVGFYANIFGAQKVKVLPLKDVTAVRKARTIGLPNAIEITHKGKTEFFTSFLSRDEAYRVICSAWCRVSAYAKLFLGAVPCDQRIRDGPPVLTTPERSRPKLESMGEAPDAESMMSELIGTKSAMPALAQPASKSEPAIHQSDGDDEEDDDEDDGSEALSVWRPEHGDTPPVPPEMKPVASASLRCGVQELCDKFFSTESGFWEKIHLDAGDMDVTLSDWQVDSSLGMVRSLNFLRKLGKVPMGPDQTRCVQTQRCRQFLTGSGSVVGMLETEQEMLDIPFGDTFKVVLRWTFVQQDEGRSEVAATVYLNIPFHKSCWVKGMIISRTTKEVTESSQAILQTMQDALTPPRPRTTASAQLAMLEEFKRTVTQRVQHNRDVRSLIDKIPTEYRHDVTRMLEITVDESLNPEMARRARGGGIYGLVADGADLLVRLVTWILVTVFKKPAAGLMLSREEIAQLVGGVLQVLVVLQSCLFLYMVLGGRSSLFAHNSAPDVAQAVASCQAQAMQLEVVTRDLAALHRLLASLAASQPSLVRAAAAALDMESAVFH